MSEKESASLLDRDSFFMNPFVALKMCLEPPCHRCAPSLEWRWCVRYLVLWGDGKTIINPNSK